MKRGFCVLICLGLVGCAGWTYKFKVFIVPHTHYAHHFYGKIWPPVKQDDVLRKKQ